MGHWTFPGAAKEPSRVSSGPPPRSTPSGYCHPASALLWSVPEPIACIPAGPPLGCFRVSRSQADEMAGRTSAILPASEQTEARLQRCCALPVGSGWSVAFSKSLRLPCNSWEIESLLISNAWRGLGSEDGVSAVPISRLFTQQGLSLPSPEVP